MSLFAIALVCNDNIIATETGEQPVFHREDLERFQTLTTGEKCILGRKTFDSLGGKPLANREFIVLSRRAKNPKIKGVTWVSTASEALDVVGSKDAWVIGGGEVYNLFVDMCSEVYLTRVELKVNRPGAKFPSIKKEDFSVFESVKSTTLDGVTYEVWVR